MAIPALPRKKLRILVLSESGDLGVAAAHKFQTEGHRVELYISMKQQKMSRQSGAGIVDRRETLPTQFNAYDLLYTVGRGFSSIAEQAKIPAIAVSKEAERLETDRAFGLETLSKAGVRVAPWKSFRDKQSAIRFLNGQKKRFVMKPNGSHALAFLSFVAQDNSNEDLISVLETVTEQHPELMRDGFILQQFVEGIEMSSGGYFQGRDFCQPTMQTWENKGLAPKPFGGPPTGEMGSHALFVKSPKLFKETTAKMVPTLRQLQFTNDFDVNCIVNEQGSWALETTPRQGFPAACLQMYSVEDFGSFLYGVATGQTTEMPIADKWCTGIVMTLPPFPYEAMVKDTSLFENYLVSGPLLDDPRLFPLDVKKEKDKLLTCGSGYLAVACGSSNQSLESAQDEAYDAAEQVSAPYLYLRTDIGDRFKEDAPKLKKWGYL